VEIGKIEKMDISIHVVRSPLKTRILSLEVGQGFVANGVEDSASFVGSIRSPATKGRKFSVKKLEIGKYRVVRVK
jgi:hypothetical protein